MAAFTSFFSTDVTHHIDLAPEALCVIETLEQKGFETWVVGGFVRDSLLGIQSYDIDMASAAPWHVSETLLSDQGFQTYRSGIAHGTLLVRKHGVSIEITTFRHDGVYRDARHPSNITPVKHVQEDILRRDFTINALCYHPSRGLLDLVGGLPDLSEGILRCVGDPFLRFSEDGLRILRACRFACRLGFVMDEKTHEALSACKEKLLLVAPERIGQELMHMLNSGTFALFCVRYPQILALCLQMCNVLLADEALKLIIQAELLIHGMSGGNPAPACALGCLCACLMDEGISCNALLHCFAFPAALQKQARMLHELTRSIPAWYLQEHVAIHHKCSSIKNRERFISFLYVMQGICLRTSCVYPHLSRAEVLYLVLCALDIIRAQHKGGRTCNDVTFSQMDFYLFLEHAHHVLAYLATHKLFSHVCELAIQGSDLVSIGFEGRMIRETRTRLAQEVTRGFIPNKKEPLLIRAAQMYQDASSLCER